MSVSYADVFGGSTVQPGDVEFRAVALSASITTVWPAYATTGNQLARIMRVTPSAGSLTVTLPDATLVGTGQDVLFDNPSATTFTVLDSAGSSVATLTSGQVKYFYLSDNSTAAGTWRVTLFGVGSSSPDASQLVGYGLKAIGATLNFAPVVVDIAIDTTVVAADRAKAYVWTGGSGILTLPTTAGSTSDWSIEVRNQGTGTLTITPVGGVLIDGSTSISLVVNESCFIHMGAADWYTVGRGRNSSFNFTQLAQVIDGGTDNLTLTQASNVVQTYTGALLSNQTINFPAVVQVYYVVNNTTGSYSLTFGCVAGGTSVAVGQTQAAVLFCDGTNVINANTMLAGAVATVIFGAGTAANPSVAIATSDNGFYSPATDQVALSINGAQSGLWTATGYTITGSGEMLQTVSSTAAGANYAVSRAAGQTGRYRWRTAGVDRFTLNVNATAESGANAGSNLELYAYDDAGASLGTVFTINRSTRVMAFTNNPTGVSNGIGSITTATTSTTLTSTPTLLTITPATPGIIVTLPDATTMTEGGPVHIIDNRGMFAVQVKNSAGTSLGFVPAQQDCHINLPDNASAAGVWGLTNAVKTAVTASFVNTTITNQAAVAPKRVALDSDRTLFVFGGVDVYGVVYNAATFTWGAATSIRTTVSSGAYLAVKTTTDQAMVVSCTTTTGFEAVILSISGTTITVETATKDSEVLAGNWAAFGQLIAVGSSWVVSYGRATNVSAIRAISVSGVTPTIGAESALTPSVATAAALYASGSVVRCIEASTTTLYAIPYTVSGSTLSVGTEATTGTTSVNRRSFVNAGGNIIVEYTNTTHYAAIFKLTTTTEAVSAASLGTSVTVPGDSDYYAFSATKTAFFGVSGGTWYANILTDTAGTASAGTQITGAVVSSIAGTPCGMFASGNNVYFGAGTADAEKYEFTFDCSGTSPVLGDVVVLTGLTNLQPTGGADKYGVRNPRMLKTSTSLNVVGFVAGSAFDSRYAVGAITQHPALSMSVLGVGTGVVSATENESYFGAPVVSSTGYIINRVESAA